MKARVADGWLVVEPITAEEAKRPTYISASSGSTPHWHPAYYANDSLRIRTPDASGVVVNVRVRIGHSETEVGRLVL